MSSRRTLKAAAAIREVVSMSILTELRDPRIANVTVTGVEVAPDMQQAKIYVSVMGEESEQQLALRGLQSASGFLQQKVAKRIDTRYTPRLKFLIDEGIKNSIAVARILKEVLPESNPEDDTVEAPEASPVETPADESPVNETGESSSNENPPS